MSPEIIQSHPYTVSTDVWSLGVVLYELCALKPPFTAKNQYDLRILVLKGDYHQIPENFSKGMRDLVKYCLNIEPSKRPTVG